MHPVILCGGEGTRLRPLTEFTPKPMVKILGEPVLKRLLKQLFAAGFTKASLCVRYLSEEIEAALGGFCEGVELKYFREDLPLGTAGCVRNAFEGDDVLILSGDGVSDFDFNDIVRFHGENSADITIVVREVDDPREYGLLSVDGSTVTGFLEKPGYDKCLTNLANTGCYVISKELISRIPKGEKLDFAADIFPEALREGKRLCAYRFSGLWHDIGDIPSLLKCQGELLELSGMKNLILGSAGAYTTASSTVIESGANLGGGSRAVASLICENSQVAAGADLCEAVIGRDCTVGEGLIMRKNSVIGDRCVVGKNVTVCEGVRVAGRTKIPDGKTVRTDITEPRFTELYFTDEGCAEGLFGAQDEMRFGAAFAAAAGERAVLLCGDSSSYEAVSLGIRAVGVDVFDLRGGSLGEGIFSSRRLGCGYLIHMSDRPRVMTSAGIPAERAFERKLMSAYNRLELGRGRTGRVISAAAEAEKYADRLREIFPEKAGFIPILKTDDPREAEIFSKIAPCGEGAEVIFTVGEDRMSVFASTETAAIGYERLLCICAEAAGERGEKIILPSGAPLLCDRLAKVFREPSRELPVEMFACDPLSMVAFVTRYLTDKAESPELAAKKLPEIIYTRSVIEAPEGLPKLLGERFVGTAGGEISMENAGAKAFVRPMKSGRAVRVYIESVSAEAAQELSDDIRRRLGG